MIVVLTLKDAVSKNQITQNEYFLVGAMLIRTVPSFAHQHRFFNGELYLSPQRCDYRSLCSQYDLRYIYFTFPDVSHVLIILSG